MLIIKQWSFNWNISISKICRTWEGQLDGCSCPRWGVPVLDGVFLSSMGCSCCHLIQKCIKIKLSLNISNTRYLKLVAILNKFPGSLAHIEGKATYLKNDYRNVIACIDITVMCDFVWHIMAILVCNKDDDRCRKYIKWQWVFYRYYWYKKGGLWATYKTRMFKGFKK